MKINESLRDPNRFDNFLKVVKSVPSKQKGLTNMRPQYFAFSADKDHKNHPNQLNQRFRLLRRQRCRTTHNFSKLGSNGCLACLIV